MEGDPSRGPPSSSLSSMEAIAQDVQILSEKTLRDIAKGPLVKFILTCNDEG